MCPCYVITLTFASVIDWVLPVSWQKYSCFPLERKWKDGTSKTSRCVSQMHPSLHSVSAKCPPHTWPVCTSLAQFWCENTSREADCALSFEGWHVWIWTRGSMPARTEEFFRNTAPATVQCLGCDAVQNSGLFMCDKNQFISRILNTDLFLSPMFIRAAAKWYFGNWVFYRMFQWLIEYLDETHICLF